MSHPSPEQTVGEGEPALASGSVVGEYEIRELLGEGGFGSVYRAIHPLIGKSAAVKVLKREFSAKPEMVARFISEARAVNQIRHRNIIDIFSFGKLDDGRQYYVMELLEGMPLDKYLDLRGKLSIGQAIPVLRQLARALGAAHAAGITHRDIKPENVFLTFDEDHQPVPKLLDFGIAKLVVDNLSQHKTRSGVPMGTPLYMSPEQVHGRDVDSRSDIYSFGVMVFQLLTGETPFTGETMMSVMMKQVGEAAPRPSAVEGTLPPAVDGPILKMLEKEPDKRPSSILEAVDELVQAAVRAGVASPVAATPTGLDPLPSQPWVQTRLLAQTPVVAPSEATIAAMGASDTLVASEAPKHEAGAGAPGKQSRRSGVVVGAVLAVALGVAGAVAFVVTRPAASTNAPASTATGAAVASSANPASAVSAGDSAGPRATVTVAPETASAPAIAVTLSPSVKLVITTTPADAEVWLGKQKLGRSGEELALPRGEQEVVLSIRKPGYGPVPLKLTPTANIEQAVTLKPQGKAQPEYGSF